MSNIEEPKNTSVKKEKNYMTAMNIVKPGGGGGGIGVVGIVFLGGAVATAAFLFITRRRKSSNSKKSQSTASTEIAYKAIEDKYMNEDKGLRFVAANSSPHLNLDQDLRNGTSSNGVHENDNTMISDETSFFLVENANPEVNGRNEDPVADFQDGTQPLSPKLLDRNMQFDASALKEKEFQTPTVVEEKMQLQPTIPENELPTQEIAYVKGENANGSALEDQGIEEDCQDVLVNIEGKKIEANGGEEEDKGGLQNNYVAEITKADQSMLDTMQSREEQESPTDGGEKSTSIGDLLPKTSEFVIVEEVSCQPKSGNSSLSNDENQGDASEESVPDIKVAIVEKDEELEAANEEQDKGDSTTQIIEVEDTLCPERFGVNETDDNANFKDQGNGIPTNLMFAEVEQKSSQHDSTLTIITKENEALEVNDEFQVEGITVIQMPGGEENLKKCQAGLLMGEALEVAEEIKVHEEAAGREETEILMGGEEKGGQHESEMTGEKNLQWETARLPGNNISASNHQEPQMDTIETSLNGYQEDNSATDEPTSESSPCKDSSANVPNVSLTSFDTPGIKTEIYVENEFKEIQQSAEASELEKENVESEPGFKDRVLESEDLPIQLAEKQEYLDDEYGRTLKEAEDMVQLRHNNITTEEQKLMRPEEEEDANNDKDESNTTEKVDERSEGTADSSAESNAEPIWPAESIQDLIMEPENMEANDSKEILQPSNEEQTVEKQIEYVKKLEDKGIPEMRLQKGKDDKGNLKPTLLERYIPQLAKLTHQTTNSGKRRILILTIVALSGSLCTGYFGLGFLKICLIIILIMVISKMHGI